MGTPVVFGACPGRLADYRDFELTAFCRACDRSVVLDKEALADQYGRDVLRLQVTGRWGCTPSGQTPVPGQQGTDQNNTQSRVEAERSQHGPYG